MGWDRVLSGWQLRDVKPVIRVSEQLMELSFRNPSPLLKVKRDGRTTITFADDFGASYTYVLTDHDEADRTFGLKLVG